MEDNFVQIVKDVARIFTLGSKNPGSSDDLLSRITSWSDYPPMFDHVLWVAHCTHGISY